jgi:hypothetical protein
VALESFAKEVGAGTKKRVLLVLDNAPWHTTDKLRVPEGVHLEFLPSSSAELQLAERLWPLSNEAVATATSRRWTTLRRRSSSVASLSTTSRISSARTPATIGGRRRREK